MTLVVVGLLVCLAVDVVVLLLLRLLRLSGVDGCLGRTLVPAAVWVIVVPSAVRVPAAADEVVRMMMVVAMIVGMIVPGLGGGQYAHNDDQYG